MRHMSGLGQISASICVHHIPVQQDTAEVNEATMDHANMSALYPMCHQKKRKNCLPNSATWMQKRKKWMQFLLVVLQAWMLWSFLALRWAAGLHVFLQLMRQTCTPR